MKNYLLTRIKREIGVCLQAFNLANVSFKVYIEILSSNSIFDNLVGSNDNNEFDEIKVSRKYLKNRSSFGISFGFEVNCMNELLIKSV